MFLNIELSERKGSVTRKRKTSESEKNYRENLPLSFQLVACSIITI